LASQTAKATTEISQRIMAVQTATSQSAGDIQEIATIIDEVSGIAIAIAAAVEEQTAVTAELAATLQQTAGNTQAVARSIETLSGSTASASNAARHVDEARLTLVQQRTSPRSCAPRRPLEAHPMLPFCKQRIAQCGKPGPLFRTMR
jgi:methyl-accepting chemotaxis protein